MLPTILVRVQFDKKSYLLSERKLLLSEDIELTSKAVDSCAHRAPTFYVALFIILFKMFQCNLLNL